MSTFSMIVRAVLLAVSFIGLCGALRTRFDLDCFVSPFTAGCGIITVLMTGGILGILKIALYGLYLLGFAGLVYCAVKRTRPKPGLLLMLALFVAFLAIRFRGGVALLDERRCLALGTGRAPSAAL